MLPPIEEIKQLIQEGKLSAATPFPGMDEDWSEEDKRAFEQALARMFNWSSPS